MTRFRGPTLAKRGKSRLLSIIKMHAFSFIGSATFGRKSASIVLFIISLRTFCGGVCLTLRSLKSPGAQQSDDQADQRAEHGKPKTDASDQRAMCVHTSFILR